jgi:polyhydroxyalkanoate synthase
MVPPEQSAAMLNEQRERGVADNDVREQAEQHTLAANPLVGVRSEDIFGSARVLLGEIMRNPGVAAQHYLGFIGELGRIAAGKSALAPDPKDRRFAHPAWKESAAYRVLAQCYLAWGSALNRFVEEANMEKCDAERARFGASLLVDALSPTNALAGNPAALRKLIETGGASLAQGLQDFVADLIRDGHSSDAGTFRSDAAHRCRLRRCEQRSANGKDRYAQAHGRIQNHLPVLDRKAIGEQ